MFLQTACILWSALLLVMTSLSYNHSTRSPHPHFLFLGFQNDEHLLHSSIEFSFEKYRLELSGLMQTLSSPLSKRVLSSPYSFLIRNVVSNFHSDISNFPTFWEENELFLRRLLQQKVPFVYCLTDNSEEEYPPPHQVSSYDSFHQLLIHLERDWGEGGKNVRRTIYSEGIIPILRKYLDPGPDVKILVPGAGLGRLAVELGASGYRVEANECSGLMIRVLYSLLIDFLPAEESVSFYPYLHFHPADEWDHNHRLVSSTFPSTDSAHLSHWVHEQRNLSASRGRADWSPRLTVQAGDFLSLYSPQQSLKLPTGDQQDIEKGYRENSFDGVVTSFFLDTGSDVLEYLITLRHILRPGGVWVNAGPLHYHTVAGTPYSYRVILEVIEGLGFVSLERNIVESSYCGEEEIFMKPEHYRYPMQAWRLQKDDDSAPQEKESVLPLPESDDTSRFVLNMLRKK